MELVVFDLAGTTVHDGDAVNASFRAALSAVGVSSDPAFVNTVMGLHKPDAIRILLAEAGRATSSETEVEAIHADFVRRMTDYYSTAPDIREVPGATAAFASLRAAGIKVALNTGFSRAVTDVLLNRLGWRVPETIDDVVSSDQVSRGRPHPDLIRTLMARLGIVDPRRVAKVGDTRADLEEGTSAGCGLVVGVTTDSFTREQLKAFQHSRILDSVAEVPGLLLN